MRILMTADAVGGVWTYALDLCRHLSGRGCEVLLATMGPVPSEEQRRQARSIPGLDLRCGEFDLEWMPRPWEDVERAGNWLLRLAADFRPDVVHLNGYVHAALPWEAPVILVGHSCVLSWWEAVKREPAPAAFEEYARRVRWGLRAADMVAAPTGAMLRDMERLYGRLGNARVISNGRDAGSFVPQRKEQFVLAAGRLWDEAKNISTLAGAAREVEWPVLVAGDDRHPDGSTFEAPGVVMLGRLNPEALAERMGRAGIYALPARYEPFGLSALEAALCGCALVLGDIPSLREVWGNAALFVDPGKPAALADAVNGLIHDPVRRADLGERARRRAGRFTAERMAESYLGVYRSLAASEQDSVTEESACASLSSAIR